MPCGISSSASPRCFELISTTDVRVTCTRTKNTIFGDCPPSACGKPPAFAFEIRLAAATSPLRFEEDARPPFGHPASNGSCLTACCRLRVDRHGAVFKVAPKRAAVFSTAIHSADQALWHSETTHRRVSKHSALRRRARSRTGARQCDPCQTFSPIVPAVDTSVSLAWRLHVSLDLPGLVPRARSWRTFRELEVPSIERSPGRAPSREPALETRIRWPANEDPHVFIDVRKLRLDPSARRSSRLLQGRMCFHDFCRGCFNEHGEEPPEHPNARNP